MDVCKTILEQCPERTKIVLCGYMGSYAHGTRTEETDDIDVMAVVIPPIEYYLGLQNFEGKQWQCDSYDFIVYELRKFIRLLLTGNPNVLSMMWLDGYIVSDPFFIGQRDMFISKRIYNSIYGYAKNQSERMEKPQQHKGYMGEKRKALFDKFGYDVKQANHVVRLLNMGIEILNTGKLTVKRPEASMLTQIKSGLFNLSEIKEMVGVKLIDLIQALQGSKLPEGPDNNKIETLCVSTLQWYLTH